MNFSTRNRLNGKRLVGAVSLCLALAAGELHASYSAKVGGSGGTSNFSKACTGGRRMTGVKVKYGSVIDLIRVRCTSFNNGNWANNSHTWTSYTSSSAPLPATRVGTATCPSNKWVSSVNAVVSNGVIQRLSLSCKSANAQGRVSGGSTTRTTGASGTGSWAGWKSCPSQGIANGIQGKSGWHLDSLRLRCVDPQAASSSGSGSTSGGSSSSGSSLSAPNLISPKWSHATNSYAQSGNWQVSLQRVTGASKYDICIRDSGSRNCYFRQKLTGRVSGGSVFIPVSIADSKQGTLGEWLARSCDSQNQCGGWSSGEKFTIVPGGAVLSSPANNSTASSRNVTFQWQGNGKASAGYQLYIYKDGISRPYDWYNPSKSSTSTFRNVTVAAGTTSYTYNVPSSFGGAVRWGVTSCANFSGKGRRCSLGGQSRKVSFSASTSSGSGSGTSSGGANFSTLLASTFRHGRCVQCHGGKPLSNHNAGQACTSCHTQSNTYKSGNLNVNWQAAPSSMNFVGKTYAQLCNMAKHPPASASASACGTSSTPGRIRCHLKKDPLVLWAVDSGRLPSNVNRTKAPPGSQGAWKQKVDQWVNGGMNCN